MGETLADGVSMQLACTYRSALDLIGVCADARTVAELSFLLPSAVHRLLGCDEASLGVVSSDRYRVVRTRAFPTQMSEVPDAARIWLTHTREHPWVEHLRSTRDPRSLRLSDLKPRAQLLGSLYWEQFYRPRHLRFSAFATLSTSNGRMVGIALNRDLRDFTRTEVDVLERLRRPLGRLWERVEAYELMTQRALDVPYQPGLDAGGRLTPAQLRVVQLVVAGLCNRAVAERLGVSEKAVEQHLTQIYRRLGVRSRTQLVVWFSASADVAHQPV